MSKKHDISTDEKVKRIKIIEPEYQAILALYEARIAAGVTQKELSKLSGIRQSNISRIERGSCSPSIRTLSALALALGRQLDIKIK